MRRARSRGTQQGRQWRRWFTLAHLTLLVLIPLPLAANRDYIWPLFAAAWWGLAAAILLSKAYDTDSARRNLAAARIPLLMLAGWLGWHVMQLLPLPRWLVVLVSAPRPGDSMFTAVSTDPHATFLYLLWSATLVLGVILSLVLTADRQALMRLTAVLFVAVTAQAIYGVAMTLTGVEWGFGPKQHALGMASGTFVNRNHFAAFCVLGIGLGVGLLVGSLGAPRRASQSVGFRYRLRSGLILALSSTAQLRLALVLLVIAVVLTHSRMGNASVLIALGVATAAYWWVNGKLPPMLALVLASILVIDVVVVGTWFGMEQVAQRIADSNTPTELVQTEGRVPVHADVLRATLDWLPAGSGMGSFETVFTAYRSAVVYKFHAHAHNDWLEFSLEAGLGALFLLALVVWLGGRAVVLLGHHNRRVRGYGFGILMATVAGTSHALVDFHFHIPAYAAYFCQLIAMAVLADQVRSRRRYKPARPRVSVSPL